MSFVLPPTMVAMIMRSLAALAALAALALVASSAAAAATEYDVAVYDATSGGVMAAVSAGRRGHRVVLMCASWPACYPEGGQRVGGMSSGGLGQTDLGPTSAFVGGLAREFYQRNRAHYGSSVDRAVSKRAWRKGGGPDGHAGDRAPAPNPCSAGARQGRGA